MKWREASVNIIIVTEKNTITSTAIIKDGDISGADLEGSHEWTFEKWRIILCIFHKRGNKNQENKNKPNYFFTLRATTYPKLFQGTKVSARVLFSERPITKKIIEDKTFGLKNKNKSTVVKKKIKRIENMAR